jgi:DNA repair protein RadC
VADRGRPRSGGRGRLTLASWPEAERPRERLWRWGPQALTDAELLALVLRTGRQGETAVDLARRVLALAGVEGLPGLSACAPEDLAALKGMGQAKAAALLAALELGRRAGRVPAARARVDSAEAAARELADMALLDREQFRVLLLNTKHLLLGWEVVGVGGLDQVAVHPREVFKPAIRRSAAAVILGHNHPSGDPEPSEADVLLTERLVAAGRLLGVGVLDHVVVARRGYVSLRARGLVAFDGP